jgi:paraquat-inducible protein B
LSYRSDPAPPVLERRLTAYPEIPTSPSLMAALGTGAGSLVADMMKVLFQVNEMLAEVDMPEINAAVVASAEAVERMVSSPEITVALAQVPVMAGQLNRTMAQIELLVGKTAAAVDPMQAELGATNAGLVATLQAMRRMVEETHGLMSTDSGLGYGMQEALASLKEAADALRLLATTLEQNPDMLIRGKKPPEE